MDVHDYIRILRKDWIPIVSLTILGAMLGFGVATMTAPTYTANTRLYVSVRAAEGAASQDLNQGTSFVRQAVASYVDIVDSALVLDRVATDLDLPMGGAGLAGKMTASSPTNTVLIDISVSDRDPAQAAAIANAVGTTFANVITNELEKPSGGESLVNVKTVQPAAEPVAPSSPNRPLLIAIGGVIGLALGVALAVLRAFFDTKVRTIQMLESLTRKASLGGIALDPEAERQPLLVESAPRTPRAEAFRRLRTSLQFLSVKGSPRAFVVTSSGPGEGKSYVAANLALALAETGASVVIVDGDLRRPRVAVNFGVEGGAGLTDVLIGRAEVEDVLQPWGTQRLSILTSGRIPPNPSELLGSEAMKATIDHLGEMFDYVIIDAPPVLLVTDAALISAASAGVLFVAAIDRVRKPDVTNALRTLASVNAVVHGTVATMLPARGPDSTAYGEYMYGQADEDVAEKVDTRRRSRRGGDS